MAINADSEEVLEQYVTDLVDCGFYASRDDVLRDGLRLMHARDTRLADLDAALARGIADADAGRLTPIDEAFDEIRAELRAKAKVKAEEA